VRAGGAQREAQDVALLPFTDAIEARRMRMARARPLAEWLRPCANCSRRAANGSRWPTTWPAARSSARCGSMPIRTATTTSFPGGRHTLAEFTAWVRDVLEDASFVPPAGDQAPRVVVLPLYQLLGRAFGAVVIPGATTGACPHRPSRPATGARRSASSWACLLREVLEAAQRAAWAAALHNPWCELLWRQSDATGEPVSPSPLVQALQLDHALQPAADPRLPRDVPVQPTAYPTPSGALLPLENISTSVYEDLRRCPYRFFALRSWGCAAPTSSTPRSTSATSATGCTPCWAISTRR
jgi:ATP-dependent helicase/nuclease subunit B